MNVITEGTREFENPVKSNLIHIMVHPFSNRTSSLDALTFPNCKFLQTYERSYLKKIMFLLKNQPNPLIVTQPDWYSSKVIANLESTCSMNFKYLIETNGDIADGDTPEPKMGWEKFVEFLDLFKSKEIILYGAQLGIKKETFSKKYLFCVGETYNQLRKRIKGVRLEEDLCLIYN